MFIRARMAAIGLTMNEVRPQKRRAAGRRASPRATPRTRWPTAPRAPCSSPRRRLSSSAWAAACACGAFVGSHDFVRPTALADVEAAGLRFLATACAEINALARSPARIACDIAGQLLRRYKIRTFQRVIRCPKDLS